MSYSAAYGLASSLPVYIRNDVQNANRNMTPTDQQIISFATALLIRSWVNINPDQEQIILEVLRNNISQLHDLNHNNSVSRCLNLYPELQKGG